jgi:HD-GYP domain-containing protein (c-di-GMP phosphodiesterase class II)
MQLDSQVASMIRALERKDGGTARHVHRTAGFAVRIAREIPGMTDALLGRVRLAAVLHDMGKLAIADQILTKSSALEADEWTSMRQHPQLGYDMVGAQPGLEDVAQGVLFHHERWDGQGYPHGLAGEQIPWIARLISVADAYDAMISTRPYREGMSPEMAFAELRSLSGTQFDPKMVRAFEKAFASSASLVHSEAP